MTLANVDHRHLAIAVDVVRSVLGNNFPQRGGGTFKADQRIRIKFLQKHDIANISILNVGGLK